MNFLNSVLLILVIAGVSLQSVVKKAYNMKIGGGAYTFAAVSSLCAGTLFFLMGLKGFKFEIGILSYSILFAISYGVGTVFSFLAIASGSLALTSLIISYSLIIPTFWGMLFLNEPTSPSLFIGLVFLFVSLLLINIKKESKKEKKAITLKWGIYVFLAFLGNGMCSTVQKLQQTAHNGAYKNEFMCIALFFVTVILFIMSFFKEKTDIKCSITGGLKWMIICGLANGLVNLFVMILSNTIPASVMFPLISAGGIIATAAVSRFLYNEKLSVAQNIGLILGIISVVFLNI